MIFKSLVTPFDKLFYVSSKHFIMVVIQSIKFFCLRYQDQLEMPPHFFVRTILNSISNKLKFNILPTIADDESLCYFDGS